MTPYVRLMATLTAILLSTPASEGVKCYQCYPCDKSRGHTIECDNGRCAETVVTEINKPPYTVRDCADGKAPATGCERRTYPLQGGKFVELEVCACNQDFCNLHITGKTDSNKNRSYAFSYQWFPLTASSLIAISHYIVRCQ